ncbi:MAG TPA: hypothetical protein VFJ16_19175 [Longimicrobium sp.]|nr:hypothetical protein [Longimicrobium sp.]
MRRISLIAAVAAALFLAHAAFAKPALAQCTWGCMCQGTACGCNSNGSGSSCTTGGSGCVVYKCGAETGPLVFGADGSPVRVATIGLPARSLSPFGVSVRSRWEYRTAGRSVARHCSGVVVARYFDRGAAAAVRQRQRTLVV